MNDIGKYKENLSDDELKVLTNILKELSEDGKSSLLDQINETDYEEVPVDIETFMTDRDYLGNSLLNDNDELIIYPYWVRYLNELFDPTKSYEEAALSGSIGQGKSTISCIGMAYILHKLLCLKDPAAYYDLAKGSKIALAILNLNLNQAFNVGYDKLQSFLKSSPWFLRHGKIIGREYPTYHPDKDIEIVVGSKMEHFIGRDIFCLSGGTIILTDKGYKSLEELEGEEFKVYQYDPYDQDISLSDTTTCINTVTTDEVYEIELDDGTTIYATGDHKLMYNNTYLSVEDIMYIIDEHNKSEVEGKGTGC